MNFSKRLELAMKATGETQAGLAKKVGMAQSSINKLLNGAKGSRKTVEIARALGVSADWLGSGKGDMSLLPPVEPSNIRQSRLKAEVWEDTARDNDEFVEIPLLNVSLSAGPGSCELEESSEFALVFRRYYLKKMGIPEKSAKLVRVSGQSMEPTLHDGDVVGINTSDTLIRDGKTYAICQADLLRVKILIATPSTVIIRSINKDEYPDETLDRDEFAKSVKVIGRVFWSSHSW
ncbi:XRE family transcriptional regulator [Edwardsiella tarda]|uniref:XRE family transcriptional regulator n=1 Tax=Edwardsiella tarda TaxID=636 RepID=UPI0020C93BDD|nr:helix-turn-helix transcriptional regulator [Edwardsiella tarda]